MLHTARLSRGPRARACKLRPRNIGNRWTDKAVSNNDLDRKIGGNLAAQASDQSGLATRYAAALFDLADSKKALDAVAGDLTSLKKMIADSGDLRRLMN